jgi:hypothetical protein
MAAFLFKLGALDLSQYVRVSPQDSLDPYGGGDWADPQFSDAPFAEGRPLLNIDTNNREMIWPLFLKGVGGGGSANPYKDAVVADSPVSYWRLAESGGTNAADNQAANNAGTYQNSPTLGVTPGISDIGDTAVTFNGTTQDVQVNDANSLDLGDTFTMEAWIKRTATLGTNQGIISKGSGGYYMRMGTGNNLELAKSQIGSIVASTTTITDTNWHHVVATKTGATCKLYIDGVDVTGAITNLTCVDTALHLRIGADGTAGDSAVEFFSGSIDEPAVYNTVLSAARVSAHYAARTGASASSGTAKDNLHTVVQNIVREINNPTSTPLRVEWKDQGASNSTFYDVTYARWDPHFNYRLSEHAYADGAVRVWCQPPYGHTATERVIATAAGTAPGLIASLIGVASPLVGDVAPQLRVTVDTSGEPVGPAGRGVIIAAPQASGYIPFISAASFVNLHPSAAVFGASGAPGSQAIYRQPLIDDAPMAQISLGATMYAGRNRLFAAVLPAVDGIGVGLNTQDQYGARTPTAGAYNANGWQIVDLGVANVPTTTPTYTVDLYSGLVRRTLNDGNYQRPLPGAAASSILAVAGVYVLPEGNLQAVRDHAAIPFVRSYFGASGSATAPIGNFIGDLGETWSGGTGMCNGSGAFLMAGANTPQVLARSVRQFHAKAVGRINASVVNDTWAVGIMNGAQTDILLARTWAKGASGLLVTGEMTKGSFSAVGSLVIPSQAGMALYPNDLVVELVAQPSSMYVRARWAAASGIAIIPSAGMAATVVPVACMSIPSTVGHSVAGFPLVNLGGTVGISFAHFDELVNMPRPSEAYRFTSVSGDTALRSPISGSGPNVSLEGAKYGPALKLSPSSVGVVAVDWQQNGGPMNDPMGVEVRCRERWSYAR